MRGWLKTGRRRPAELEEAPEAPPVDEQSAEPIERPLVVLLPGMGSFLSFELHSFSDARSALELLEARSIKDVREVNAFWTLQGPPPARADSPSEAEVLVLTRDSDRPQMVHLISFTDIDAAYAFIRAEVNEGLPLESVLVYWSLPIAIKRDRIGVITMSPSVCPSFDQIAEERTQSPVFETVEAPIRDEAAALAEAEPQTPDEEPKRWRDWLPAPAPSLQPLFPPALSGTIGLDFEEPAAEVAEPEVAEPEVHPVADGQLMPGDLDELMRSLTEEAAERLPLTADENKRLVEAELGLLPLSEPDTMSKEEPQEAAPEAKLWPEPGVEAGLGLGAPPDNPEAAEPEPIAQAFPEPELILEVVPEPLAEVAPEMPTPVEDIAEPPLRDVEVLDEKPQVSQPEPRLWPESMVEMAAPPAEPKGAEPEPTTEVPPEQDPVPEIMVEAVAEVTLETPALAEEAFGALVLKDPMAADEDAMSRFLPPELWMAEVVLDQVSEAPEAEPQGAITLYRVEAPPAIESTAEPEAVEAALAESASDAELILEADADLPDVRIGELPEPPTDLAEAPALEPQGAADAEPVETLDVEAPATEEPAPLLPLSPHPIEAAAEEMAAAAELAAASSRPVVEPEPIAAELIGAANSDLNEVDIEALWERVSSRDRAMEVDPAPKLNEAAVVEENTAEPPAPDSLESIEALMGELKQALKSRRKEAPNREPFKGFDSPPGRF